MRLAHNTPILLAAFLVSFATARSADAVPITFTVKGVVDLFVSSTGDNPLEGTFSIGQTFTARYTFESTTPDLKPEPTRGAYVALTALTVTVGNYTAMGFSGNSPITVFDNFGLGGDIYRIDIWDGFSGPNVGDYELSSRQTALLLMNDETGTAFSSDALPNLPLNISRFQLGFMALEFVKFYPLNSNRVSDAFVIATITSFVPEPFTAVLVASAFASLLVTGRRFGRSG